jgi:hypothetical protein
MLSAALIYGGAGYGALTTAMGGAGRPGIGM